MNSPTTPKFPLAPIRRVTSNLDHLRVPLNALERAERPGSIPYWGANSVVDHVDTPIVDGKIILIGEDGAPFLDKDRPVAFSLNEPIWPNNHVHVLRATGGNDHRFISFALNAVDYRLYIKGSTRDKLNQADLSSINIPLPAPSVQRRIADYLDHETAEIDALIEDLTLLSITVREFFEASLNQQTNQPWQTGASDDKVIPLTRALPERVDYRGATPLKTVSGTQLVTARNVRQGWIDYKTNQEFVDTNEYYSIMSRGIPKLGDILFTMEAPLGNVALVDRTDIALAQRIIKFSAADFVQPKFILYAIMSQSFQSQLLTLASGSTALGLKASKLNQLKVRVPSIGSQRKIVEEIELLFNRSVGVRRDIERAVEVARERRAALITAAVTGQIDVTAKNRPAAEQLEDDIAQGLHKES